MGGSDARGTGRGEQQVCKERGEAERGGQRGNGGGAWCAHNLGERAVVHALEGDAPLFVAADFFSISEVTALRVSEIGGLSPFSFNIQALRGRM